MPVHSPHHSQPPWKHRRCLWITGAKGSLLSSPPSDGRGGGFCHYRPSLLSLSTTSCSPHRYHSQTALFLTRSTCSQHGRPWA
jgi:hypothetical protein